MILRGFQAHTNDIALRHVVRVGVGMTFGKVKSPSLDSRMMPWLTHMSVVAVQEEMDSSQPACCNRAVKPAKRPRADDGVTSLHAAKVTTRKRADVSQIASTVLVVQSVTSGTTQFIEWVVEGEPPGEPKKR